MQTHTEMTNEQIATTRFQYLDLLKSFFIDLPDADKMERWRQAFEPLSRENISPLFDNSSQRLSNLLSDKSLENIQDEYYQLFLDPYSEAKVETTVSSLIDGRSYGPSLAKLRSFLNEAGLEIDRELTESEDSLVVMLDILAHLIADENDNPALSRTYQERLLEQYLEPFATKFSKILQENSEAEFYSACAIFLNGYLDLERGLAGNPGQRQMEGIR